MIVSLFLYAFVASFTPGPNNIMAMTFANQFGLRKTMRFCLGVGTGFFVIILLCCYFNILLINFIPKIESIMAVIGGVYMFYLAFKIITSKHQENDGSGDKHNSFIAGMLLQFINPKGILYGITVTSTFILTSHSSYFSLLSYSIVLALIGFMGTFSWCLCGSLFKKMISKYRSQFNILMGLLLVYCGVSIVIG
ncbi:LysE family transporter [Paenibacillus odorifer]|uniref:LysE family transporter n=1 Tax=Paenibacillus TaxID=44249 RepID=UPI000979CEE5|nr:LysE family transporter [Paenibacillus odorifer]OME37255.1 lysine transporter LysE [Paenibacillus odorifer]OME41194.1 lysine transporter LysE [Paenibacillus odorifer]